MKKIVALFLSLVLCGFSCISAFAGPAASVHYFTNQTGRGSTSDINSYLNNTGYSSSLRSNWSNTSVRDDMSGKAIFHIWSHGMPGGMVCYSGNLSAQYRYDTVDVSLAEKYGGTTNKLRNSRLIYFEGCSTAVSNYSRGDLNNYAYSTLGADCALGYLETIYYSGSNGCVDFSRIIYQRACYESMSISNAIAAARNDMYSMYGDDRWKVNSIERCGDTFLVPPAYGVY